MSGEVFDMWEVKELAATFDAAAGAIDERAADVVAKAALDGVREAKYAAPVDTGFLMNSISADIDGLEAQYGPTAHYGIYVEHGTSRMAGQPFLGPSLQVIAPSFTAAMMQLGAEVL